jgi:hypothetical protein
MTTIDNLAVTTEQAKEFQRQRILQVAAQLAEAEPLADAAAEILNNPAFVEATRLIMERSVAQFFASTLADKAQRTRAYAMNMMHQLYLSELRTMATAPERLAGDLAALQERYELLDALL